MPHARMLRRALSIGILALGTLALVQSLAWRGAAFPGFFVMPNRVIPSAGLSDWPGVATGRPLYQQVLVAVDDRPAAAAADAYRAAGDAGPGGAVRYTFTDAGREETRTVPARTFTPRDHLLVFGAYFVTGLAYLLLAAIAGERWELGAAFRGFAVFGWIAAVFAFTAIDLYGRGTFFRLHVLAETGLVAGATQLALVCPRDLLARRPRLRSVIWGGTLGLALAYELFLYDPRAYVVFHNATQALAAIPVLAFATGLAFFLGRAAAEARRRGMRACLAGAMVGIVAPAFVFGLSGLSGGLVSVTAAAWLGFVFPVLSLPAVRSRSVAAA
ncbi:MAG: hypothetical protein KIT14_06095 [bacterium]|nr:hypothetical protein [bacterium]